jgi:hypothetical protein
MRLAVAVVVLALVVAGAAGAATVDPKAPLQRHTAADTKRANAIVLRRSDLAAGWTLDPPAKSDPPCTAGPDESSFVQTAKVDPSFTWSDGVTNVGSEVDVFRTAAEAQKDWNASTPSLLETCLLQSARAGAGKTVRVKLVSMQTLTAPKGGQRSLHYRFVFSFRSKGTANLVIDLVAFERGRVNVVLHTLSVKAPLPASAIKALSGLLATRLDAGHGVTA